jgi:hypothetical protein
MIRKLALLTLPAILSVVWPPDTRVRADSSPIPVTAYPPHTRITYFPDWTNRQFDCNFGWVCEGSSPQPYLHIMTEDQLHRTGGWATWGEWHDDDMGFELYSSIYDSGLAPDAVQWNQAAATDESTMLVRGQDATAVVAVPSLVPQGETGRSFAYHFDRPYWHALFLTVWWGGDHEIEAVTTFPLKKKSVARRYLIKQIHAAIRAAQKEA